MKKDGEEKMVSLWKPFISIESMMDNERVCLPINRDLVLLKYVDRDDGLE